MSNVLVTLAINPYQAPTTINLPKGVFDTAMKAMWDSSYYTEEGYHTTATRAPVLSKVRECGYTVFQNAQSDDLSADRFRCSPVKDSIGTVPSDLELPDPKSPVFPDFNMKPVGLMHSHPSSGRVTSLDSTDAHVMLLHQLNFQLIVTGHGTVFMYLRTQATKGGITEPLDADWTNKEMDDVQARLDKIPDVQKWEKASEAEAQKVAQHFQLAFYKGTGLAMSRIWPKPGEKPPSKHKPTSHHRR